MNTYLIIAVVIGAIILTYYLLFYGLIYGAEYQRLNGKRLKKLIELGKLKPTLNVYDLGAGFGRIGFKAAQTGASTTLVEIDPVKIIWLRSQAQKKLAFNMATNITVLQEDIRKVDLTQADIIYCYLSAPLMQSIAQRVEQLKVGCQIISAEHRINKWKPVFEDKEDKIYVYEIGTSNILGGEVSAE